MGLPLGFVRVSRLKAVLDTARFFARVWPGSVIACGSIMPRRQAKSKTTRRRRNPCSFFMREYRRQQNLLASILSSAKRARPNASIRLLIPLREHDDEHTWYQHRYTKLWAINGISVLILGGVFFACPSRLLLSYSVIFALLFSLLPTMYYCYVYVVVTQVRCHIIP